ncbi:MAG TPA: hypothetical protein VK192_06430 [Sphingomicrobium sp.]|nr:hypothetical protein [Sphingomicrobium sp.]
MEGAYQPAWHPRPEQMVAVSGQDDLTNPAGDRRGNVAEVRAFARESPGEVAAQVRGLQTSKPIKHGLY